MTMGLVFFLRKTMELPAGTMKDLTEVCCTSEGAALQCKNMTSFSNLHHKDDLVCMSWCTSSHCHVTSICDGGAIKRMAREINLQNL